MADGRNCEDSARILDSEFTITSFVCSNISLWLHWVERNLFNQPIIGYLFDLGSLTALICHWCAFVRQKERLQLGRKIVCDAFLGHKIKRITEKVCFLHGGQESLSVFYVYSGRIFPLVKYAVRTSKPSSDILSLGYHKVPIGSTISWNPRDCQTSRG